MDVVIYQLSIDLKLKEYLAQRNEKRFGAMFSGLTYPFHELTTDITNYQKNILQSVSRTLRLGAAAGE